VTNKDIDIINQLVGDFTDAQIQNLSDNLESYINPQLSLFVPIYRYCEYAVSPNHSHPAYSFIYTIHQKGCLIVNGKIKPNPLQDSSCICALSPGVPHEETVEEGFSNYIAVFISKEYFEKAMIGYSFADAVCLEGEFFPADENLLYLLKLLMLEYNTKKEAHSQFIESLNALITHQIIRIISGDRTISATISTSNKIETAIAYMHDNLASKITVNDIAEHVNTSPSHFTKLFKDTTRKTPIEYLSKIRLEKAKRLLKLSDKNLTEIAFDCGFSTSSYFSHSFIEAVKLTPSEYRKKFMTQENIVKNT